MGKITNRPQEPVSANSGRESPVAAARETAILALGFLAADPERLDRFLALTGLSPTDVPALLRAGVLHIATLDHLVADEPLLLAFAAAHDMPPEAVEKARRALAGFSGRADD